jgi:hypothetical protein
VRVHFRCKGFSFGFCLFVCLFIMAQNAGKVKGFGVRVTEPQANQSASQAMASAVA